MGSVDYTFIIRRIAERYAEIYIKEGHAAAVTWWKSFPYVPRNEEENLMLKSEIKQLLNIGD